METYQTDYVGEKVRFHVAGEWVESTKHHPVWVAEGEGLADRPKPDHVREAELEVESATVPGRWVDAGDLRVGDVLLKRSGQRVAIETIEVEAIVTQVYNFQVAELHNYAVGRNGLLVHNNAPCANPFGRNGGPAHQAAVNKTVDEVAAKGLIPKREFHIPTPGGIKGRRFSDVAGLDPITGKVVELHQIRKQTLTGIPVSRERNAINDIFNATGIAPIFTPYN